MKLARIFDVGYCRLQITVKAALLSTREVYLISDSAGLIREWAYSWNPMTRIYMIVFSSYSLRYKRCCKLLASKETIYWSKRSKVTKKGDILRIVF